jgi:hypothetical protein
MRKALLAIAVLLLAACLPPDVPGSLTVDVGPATYSPDSYDGVGAFRTNCHYTRYLYDDPIVFPGQPGMSHLHVFFGNDAVNAHTTTESLLTTGGSSCPGGIANRSAYWVPATIDSSVPLDENGDPAVVLPWDNNEVPWLDNNGAQIYYKTGYQGVLASTVQEFPEGLRIIAGQSPSNSTAPNFDTSVTHFYCLPQGVFAPYNRGVDIQRGCNVNDTLVQEIRFPQCWDGRNLDSLDHRSHMAYALGVEYPWPPGPPIFRGCPESHPVPLPEITVNVRYLVPEGGIPASARLSSDTYDPALPGGYSLHADWWNGWTEQPEFGGRRAIDVITDNCLRPGLDCHMNLLGDGRELL